MHSSPFPSSGFLLKRKALFSLQGDRDAKMYTGELHLIGIVFFKSFALFRHRTSKKNYFP